MSFPKLPTNNLLEPIFTTMIQFSNDLQGVLALIRIAVFNSIMRIRNTLLLIPRLITNNPLTKFWRNKVVEAQRDAKTLQKVLDTSFTQDSGSSNYRNKGVEETQTLAVCKPKEQEESSQNTYDELKCTEDKINTVVANKSTNVLRKIVWGMIILFIILCGLLASIHAWSYKFKHEPFVLRILLSILFFIFGIPYLIFFIFFGKQSNVAELAPPF